jgi:hypothetical protein
VALIRADLMLCRARTLLIRLNVGPMYGRKAIDSGLLLSGWRALGRRLRVLLICRSLKPFCLKTSFSSDSSSCRLSSSHMALALKFHEVWFSHSKVDGGIHRPINRMVIA